MQPRSQPRDKSPSERTRKAIQFPDRSETIRQDTIAKMIGGLPALTTVDISDLDPSQADIIAQVFKVPPTAIQTFRWGITMAPAGHPHSGSTWYTIEYGEAPYKAIETIRVGAAGDIIERTKE